MSFSYATYPRCDTAVVGVVTKGPSHHRLDPCGCRVSTLITHDFAGDDRPRAMTDGGETTEVSDRDTDEMAIWKLREEFGELQECVNFWDSYEGQEEAWDRRDAVWNALEARTEIKQPECPKCGARGGRCTMSLGAKSKSWTSEFVEECDNYERETSHEVCFEISLAHPNTSPFSRPFLSADRPGFDVNVFTNRDLCTNRRPVSLQCI